MAQYEEHSLDLLSNTNGVEQLRSMVLIYLRTTVCNSLRSMHGLDLSEDDVVEQSEEHDIDC
jgi:hypothetical protein